MGTAEFFAELGIAVPTDANAENVMVPCFANPSAHVHEDRNKSLSLHIPTGRFRCHGCGVAGNAYSAARMLGVSERDAARLAKHHGLFKESPRLRMPTERKLMEWRIALQTDPRVIEACRRRRGWTGKAMVRCGLGWDGERITFPIRQYKPGYPTVHLKCVGLLRYLPGAERKMMSLAGSKRLLFPAPVGDPTSPLFVVEGEPAAVSVRSAGFQAVAVPGASSWSNEWSWMIARFKRVVILPDCDEPGRKLALQIVGVVPHAEIVDLDHSRHDGYDIGDFLVEAGLRGAYHVLRTFAEFGNGS